MLQEHLIAKPMLLIDVTVASCHTHQLIPLPHTILLIHFIFEMQLECT